MISLQFCKVPITDLSVLLLGNKCDLTDEREVPRDRGEELAASIGAVFYETSCKTGENIDKVFMVTTFGINRNFFLYYR